VIVAAQIKSIRIYLCLSVFIYCINLLNVLFRHPYQFHCIPY